MIPLIQFDHLPQSEVSSTIISQPSVPNVWEPQAFEALADIEAILLHRDTG
jgi:hypothetical protein